MAVFANGFNGSQTALKLITDNIMEKSILIDNISIDGAADINTAGDVAYYFKRGDKVITSGDAGRRASMTSTGLTRESFDLNQSFMVYDIIPLYKNTTSVDIISDR